MAISLLFIELPKTLRASRFQQMTSAEWDDQTNLLYFLKCKGIGMLINTTGEATYNFVAEKQVPARNLKTSPICP